MTKSFLSAVTLHLILFMGCGDDDFSPDPPSVDAGQVTPEVLLCASETDYNRRCGVEGPTLNECVYEPESCLSSLFREDTFEVIYDCIENVECGSIEDCFIAEDAGFELSDAGRSFTESCLAKSSACGVSFSDDLCFSDPLTDEAFSDLRNCLEVGCEGVRGCMEEVWACPE